MANRKNTFLIKRSNVAGKVPVAGDLQLGELALNTADNILYASGTTANSILPIGWDRVARTGDTMTGSLYAPSISATTISATTYLNLPSNTFTGGTVSGATNFINGLSANTFSAGSISVTNYIDFNTGTTTPTNVSGRVFFDNQSHSLAYFPDINQNVRVEVGQQLYIRGFNNTGSIIPKGTVLSIQSATNGLPNFTPAANTHRGFSQVIGLAASDIPVNSNGLALSQGILSGITINTFNVGDILYASPFSAGTYVADTNTFPFSARTNQIGYVIATGTSTGEIYVNINNEDENLTLTDIERNILDGNVISTGAYEFTGISKTSNTTFDIAPVKGWIVKNTYDYATRPDVLHIIYSGQTGLTTPYLTTANSTYVFLTSGGTISLSPTQPTPQERRENIFLGKLVHPTKTVIQNVNNTVDYDVSPMSAIRDLFTPIKLINEGITISANGANMSFNQSYGTLWGNGIGWCTDQLNPNSVTITAQTPTTFQYRTQTGGTFSDTTTIDNLYYDVNGVRTIIPGNNGSELARATNQRVYLFSTGVVRVQYGQSWYDSLTEAIAAIQSETFTEYVNNKENGILIGVISATRSCTSLNNATTAKISFVSKFGESFGGTGGLSTTTLQQAYNNSTNPEIVINSTLDGLSIQNGTGNADNITHLIQGLNTAGNTTSFIRADGDISGTTLQTNGFTGNSTGMSALTVNIRTIGSGTPLTNLGIDSSGNVVSGTTGGSTFTGGTVTGPTNFTNGLTANTISATTIQTASFIANNGGITANTVSATTYYNLPNVTFQNVYTASTTPLITTNNTQNGLGIKNGGVSNGDAMLYIQDNTNTVNIELRADGTINAKNYLNLPKDVFVTGGTYNGITGTLSLTNNTGNTFSITGFSLGGGGSVFTGGTVTGPTTFTNGLTANTISATTYYGLPNDVYVTGGTYSAGTAIFTNNSGSTFNVSGFGTSSTDTTVTGGTYSNGITTFTNNTGGTFNVTSTTTYAAGVISGATYSSTGTGQINLPAIKVALYNNANNIEPILIYDVASGTTGTGGIPELVDNDTNYILVEYNGGTPRYYVYDNDGPVDDSSAVLFMVVYRTGNFVHTLEFGNQGAGLVNKLNDRFIMTDRFGYESGLALSLSASTGIVMLSSGVAWNGPNRQSITAVNSSGSTFFKNYHVGGAWTATTTGKTINNSYYDNGTDIVSATAGKYLTNWYFRGQETNGHLYEVYSSAQYDSVALAQLSVAPSLPELITSHAILVGRIIVGVGVSTGLTESAFVNTFQSTNVTSHNDLVGIQGGTAGQYYHLTSNQYNNLALTNTNNYFSVGQTVNGTLSASTFTITSTPVNSNNNAQILSRNSTTGDIEYIDVSVLTGATAPSNFNYGLANAMVNFNFLT